MLNVVKKETLVIIFYVLYFSWLFTVTYLTQDQKILNYYTLAIAGFYILFLKEKGDFFWFLTGIAISLMLSIASFAGFQFKFDQEILSKIPIWLPIAWGTTMVALRKFIILMQR